MECFLGFEKKKKGSKSSPPSPFSLTESRAFEPPTASLFRSAFHQTDAKMHFLETNDWFVLFMSACEIHDDKLKDAPNL